MSNNRAVGVFCGLALLVAGVACTLPAAAGGPMVDPPASEAIMSALGTAVHLGVEATLAARAIPPTPTNTPPPPTATVPPCRLWVTADYDTPVREGPSSRYNEAGRFLAGQQAEATGRDLFYSWWVIIVNGRQVWVSGLVVTLSDCANYPQVVTPPPPPANP
jgi:hypothetical protein